jgi:hypothetical protein
MDHFLRLSESSFPLILVLASSLFCESGVGSPGIASLLPILSGSAISVGVSEVEGLGLQ